MARVATLNYKDRRVLSMRVWVLHWLMVLLAGLSAVLIALPSVVRQPTFYAAQSVVQFDPAAFPALLNEGTPSPALREQQENLGGVLRLNFEDLGRRGLEYAYPAAGQIAITAYSLDAAVAPEIASRAAEGLTRRLYAISGTETLRALLGHEYHAVLLSGENAAGASPANPELATEHELLRRLLLTQALDNIVPQQGSSSIAVLTDPQRQSLTRALEVLIERTEINLSQAQQAERSAGTEAERTDARERARGAISTLNAVRSLTGYMYRQYGTSFDVYSSAPAFVGQRPAAATVVSNYGLLKLSIAGVVGLIGGLLTVLIDRQVGILTKLQELWNYRELIRNMVGRDLKARYKNSVLGYIWSLLNPLLMMLIFWLVFSLLLMNDIKMYPVFLIVALLPWNFAVTAVSGGMRSILDNSNLVKKVYFPREILPITVVLSNLVNYIFALPVMFLVMAGVQWYTLGEINFSWTFAFLPVIIIIQTIFLIGMSLLLSTIAVFFRDTTHIIDILIQLWIFLTPVFFSLEQIATPMQAKLVRWLNPMASIVDFYRDILYGQTKNLVPVPGLPALDGVFRTLLTALVILALGSYVFHRYSGRFGEEI
ncbi:MAG: ABC transporter permease [Chloroflexi bacterium]|nr:ABC transporter permease [Chloroflexota bacterium]